MPPNNKPTHYRLTPKAVDDLEGIWAYTVEKWSITQADHYVDGISKCFETIVAVPMIARERTEFSPPVHIHPHEGHLVVYKIEGDHIVIIRLLGGHQNWQAILQAIDN